MSRSARAQVLRSIRLEAERRGAPLTPEEREQRPAMHSPAIPITQEMVDEMFANDETLLAWREQEARPRLW